MLSVTIKVPKEFESHWNRDRFKESLERLSFDANELAGNYERELVDMLIKSFQEAEVSYMNESQLYELYRILQDYHVKYFSQIRFGQLMSNFNTYMSEKYKNIDLFYLENDEYLTYFKEYVEVVKRSLTTGRF